ncbi:MAG: 2-amino-4-hydroxy-6-hydroxymethyldihydropteridine diphosphokinase [Phycisphaerae bacterium]|nr:2-amino-4-hydroxy-6-hydroxymethyldihydropteridine diphosphokinase [Phycisphaerae bacterium]
MPDRPSGHVAYVALGSNLGDRAAILQGTIDDLRGEEGVEVDCVSGIRRTKPVGGPPNQDDYLNAVVRLRTKLGPFELLDLLQDIEQRFARRRLERWGPRTLDLDLLLYDDAVLNTERLTVPHPRMHERRFVLEPLCDVAPDTVHPVLRRTARELLEDLP